MRNVDVDATATRAMRRNDAMNHPTIVMDIDRPKWRWRPILRSRDMLAVSAKMSDTVLTAMSLRVS
jgi:hypothetical protein